ncbi:MAG: DNA-deoxyinosine glycosylase [Rhodoferax sp.]|nr:DNA-deoxyinosine glycosylase [Rhodoferax sp.]
MSPIYSFPPIECPAACVLVLGSMPGVASLRLQQYYGHPQNAFWKIVGEVLGFDPAMAYEQRTAALVQRRVALWDVLASCMRQGSLDAAIDDASVVANDFAAFFKSHPHIVRVCFNGAKAESVYRKHVAHHLGEKRVIDYVRLPSTSPAHAGMRFQAKVAAWRMLADGQ